MQFYVYFLRISNSCQFASLYLNQQNIKQPQKKIDFSAVVYLSGKKSSIEQRDIFRKFSISIFRWYCFQWSSLNRRNFLIKVLKTIEIWKGNLGGDSFFIILKTKIFRNGLGKTFCKTTTTTQLGNPLRICEDFFKFNLVMNFFFQQISNLQKWSRTSEFNRFTTTATTTRNTGAFFSTQIKL